MNACPKLPPAIKSPRHLGFLHQLFCVICGALEVHVHHLRRGLTRRGQYKAGDNEGLPLCPFHHNIGDQSLHGQEKNGVGEIEYLEANGVGKPVELSHGLFARTGDYEGCCALIEHHRSLASLGPMKARTHDRL